MVQFSGQLSFPKEVVDLDDLDVQSFKKDETVCRYLTLWDDYIFRINPNFRQMNGLRTYLGIPLLKSLVKKITEVARAATKEGKTTCSFQVQEGLWRAPEITALCQRVVKQQLQIDQTSLVILMKTLQRIFMIAGFQVAFVANDPQQQITFTWPNERVFRPKCTIKTLEHDRVLFNNLDDLRKTNEFTDFKIVAQGTEFPCHRVVLAANSPVFRRLCQAGMKEGQSGKLTLDQESKRTVELALDFFYTGEAIICPTVLEEYLHLLAFAHQYEVVKMREVCEQATTIDATSVLVVYKEAKMLDNPILKRRCTDFLALHVDMIPTKDLSNLDEDELDMYLDASYKLRSYSPGADALVTAFKAEIEKRKKHSAPATEGEPEAKRSRSDKT